MVKVNIEKIKELQQKTKNIRNICILAHVDHGKTTLADSLIASNEIISQRLAGQLRYMDSRTDEQERQITMKCSSISLYHKSVAVNEEFLINLIDSPGHVDFSSEVSTAIRLCDGAVIVVDAVEGVCAQTRVCLQQAYNEHLKPVLFINKIDRLIMEMDLNTTDAYKRITQILEQINAVLGNIFASDVLSKETEDSHISALEDSDDSSLYFDPLLGNVIFGSALDNWGFTIDTFAALCAPKLQMSVNDVKNGLWGNFYYSQAKKKIENGASDKGRKPMFVSMILDPIWKIYSLAMEKQNTEFEAFGKKLGLNLTKRDLNFVDPRVPIKALFSQWLSLHQQLFEMIVQKIPAPNAITTEKLYKLLSTNPDHIKSLPEETQNLTKELSKCDPLEATKIVFVSKMFAVNVKTSPELQKLQNDPNDDEVFLAFARVYSGTLRVNDKVFVLGPKHSPNNVENSPYITEITVKHLFQLMGRDLEAVTEVPAGNIVGIGGLESVIFKTATLSTTPYCPPFIDLPNIATPILRVAVEPKNLQDMPKLLAGLKLLNQADPCVQVLIQETGEHCLLTLGEVHLERCIKDLEETFAKIEVQTSKPIVPFRETIVKFVPAEDAEDVKLKTREDFVVEMQTANKLCQITMRAAPLPAEVTKLLEDNAEIISKLLDNSSNLPKIEEFKKNLIMEMEKNDTDIPFKSLDQIWSIATKKVPTNILLNCTDFKNGSPFLADFVKNDSDIRSKYDNSFINGFQLATQCGPICEEPMQGVCFIIEKWEIQDVDTESTANYGPFSGQIISVVKEACKRAFQLHPQRLVTPMYTCTIVVDVNVLNKLYAVIGKRNGEIVSADLIEGSGQFSVTANLPVIESFNFAKQIRTETSGLAMPQLIFSHWKVLEMDPYWVPTTKEEIEQYGDKADSVNVVRVYMDSVRERKGLYVEKKVVEHAEKQRTLSKNK
ncbi:elongation factor-like GTPase 1 [Culicoides brevitarsis]|uniref:elongation factor-like GTPase 1 n=1 Tax=Culicoides brevitarsis TaxID=469753 RepID=UPI00307BED72